MADTCCTIDHSDLVRAWIEDARKSTHATSLDRIVYALGHDRRVGRDRASVLGAVIDGEPERRGPAVILCMLNTDDDYQECGVVHVDQARAVIEALRMAWPELREEAPCTPAS